VSDGADDKPEKPDKAAKAEPEKPAKSETAARKAGLEDTDVIKRPAESREAKSDEDADKEARAKKRRDAIARVLADEGREGKREKKRAELEEDEAPRAKRRGGLSEALGIEEAGPRPPSKWRRRFVYLLILATSTLVVWVLSVRNHDRFYLVCLSDRIEPQRGNQWPWGRDPIGGDGYAAVKIPAEADCRERTFVGQEALDHALADLLLGRIEAEVKSGTVKLEDVAGRLTQAQLLTRGRPEARARLQSLSADLAYLRGRQSVDQAAGSLRAAINFLKDAKARGAASAKDADVWIEHLERLLPSLASPRVAPPLPTLTPAPASAPAQPKAAPAAPGRDAGAPPAPPPGGVLM
jgi:hypothetical protein